MATIHFTTTNPDTLEEMVLYLLFYRREWAYRDKELFTVFPVETLIQQSQQMRTWGSAPALIASFYVDFPDCQEGDELAVWFRLKFLNRGCAISSTSLKASPNLR